MKNFVYNLDYFKIAFKYYFKINKPTKQMYKDLSEDVLKIRNLTYEVVNKENLNNLDGSILIANHQDNIDIFLLIAALDEKVNFVAKEELFKFPLVKKFIKNYNAYPINRKDQRQSLKLLKEVVKNVNNNNENIIIFPEGTRSKKSIISPFNTAIFSAIRKVKKPIIPICIENSYYQANTHLKVIIGKPIYTEDLKANHLRDLVFNEIIYLKANESNKIYDIIFKNEKDKEVYNYFIEYINKQDLIKSIKFFEDDINYDKKTIVLGTVDYNEDLNVLENILKCNKNKQIIYTNTDRPMQIDETYYEMYYEQELKLRNLFKKYHLEYISLFKLLNYNGKEQGLINVDDYQTLLLDKLITCVR